MRHRVCPVQSMSIRSKMKPSVLLRSLPDFVSNACCGMLVCPGWSRQSLPESGSNSSSSVIASKRRRRPIPRLPCASDGQTLSAGGRHHGHPAHQLSKRLRRPIPRLPRPPDSQTKGMTLPPGLSPLASRRSSPLTAQSGQLRWGCFGVSEITSSLGEITGCALPRWPHWLVLRRPRCRLLASVHHQLQQGPLRVHSDRRATESRARSWVREM